MSHLKAKIDLPHGIQDAAPELSKFYIQFGRLKVLGIKGSLSHCGLVERTMDIQLFQVHFKGSEPIANLFQHLYNVI